MQLLLDAIRKVTDKRIWMTSIRNTHADHVSGNVELPATADIVTQENTAANMKAMRPNFCLLADGDAFTHIFTQNNGKGLAKRTFKDRMTIGAGNDRIELCLLGRAYTDGDAYVVFFPLSACCTSATRFRRGHADHGHEQRWLGVGLCCATTDAKASVVKTAMSRSSTGTTRRRARPPI